jgi:hypothetical protein
VTLSLWVRVIVRGSLIPVSLPQMFCLYLAKFSDSWVSNTWNFSSYWKKEERIALAEDLIEKVCCNHSKCLFKLNLSRQVQVVGFSVSLGKDHDLIKGTNVYKHTANICCSPYLLCISGTISLLQIPGVDFGPHGKCTYSVYRESMLPWTLLDDR